MIGLTLVAATFWLAPLTAEGRVIYEISPDHPKSFGYRMAWLAVRTRDTGAVAEALGVSEVTQANWSSGLGTVYDNLLGQSHIYITPPVNGWTFVVGLPLPHPVSRGFVDKCTPFLVGLGAKFVEVQYFYSYPPIDVFAWARVLDGRLVRAFAINDEGVIWSKGRPTKDERALGLRLFELRGVRGRKGDAGGELLLHPTEDHVMRLAHGWSMNPIELDKTEAAPSLGLIAVAPLPWRAERLRRSA